MEEEELERFRRQWQQEVSSRNRHASSSSTSHSAASSSRAAAAQKRHSRQAPAPRNEGRLRPEDEGVPGWDFDNLQESGPVSKLEGGGSVGRAREDHVHREPQSALEHYERAVERESQGKLGDSLVHYRRAFKLDDRVDVKYKNKHFPPTAFQAKPAAANKNAEARPAELREPAADTRQEKLGAVSELVASFASEPILGAPPVIERTPPPPCPVASMPHEILFDILLNAALDDVASFARLALVCKRFAYLIATEEQIWRRVCSGPEFGFGGMRYHFAYRLFGKAGENDDGDARILPGLSSLSLHPSSSSYSSSSSSFSTAAYVDPTARLLNEPSLMAAAALDLPLTPAYPTYRHMHFARPRLRFAGVYISTVNYIRPGASSPTQVTWNSPVHVVTYYRYLRFFRDGACLSLLTTAEPAEVVPHFRPESVGLGHGAIAAAGGGAGVVAVAKSTLKGRWRLSASEEVRTAMKRRETTGGGGGSGQRSVSAGRAGEDATAEKPEGEEGEGEEEDEPEGNVYVETKGAAPAYTYCLQLALRSAAGTAAHRPRNTKLAWRAFWSYNRLTDDWAEFALKNDRAFVWSRVRSWADA